MNYSWRPLLAFTLLAVSVHGYSELPPVAPQTEKMEPRVAKPGTVIKVSGKALDRDHVDEVYLTDHRFDMKVKVLDQASDHLTIRVPPFAKPGRLQLLLLTAGNRPVYLEQPLFVQIEGDEEIAAPPPTVEISQKSKPTVEVASSGTSIPVPAAGAPPSPATTSGVERSIVPLRPEPLASTPPNSSAPPKETQASAASAIVAPQAVQTVPSVPAVAKPASQLNPASVPAQIVRRTRVTYPPAAQSQRVEGVVELIAVIRADGRVKEVKVLKGNPYLAGAAISSVREWLYEPAYVQGQPVESEVSVVLNFKRPQ